MRLLSCLFVLLLPTVAAASSAGYARPTSQLKKSERPSAYQPLWLLDGKPTTVWCEGVDGDGTGEGVAIGFKGSTSIDEIRIVNGNNRSGESFLESNRVRRLVVRGETDSHNITLVDGRSSQTYKLESKLEGDRIELEIGEVFEGTGESRDTCLSDVVFLSRGRALNGAFLKSKLGYDRGRAVLMNRWFAGPEGAPDRFLWFFFDGTFRFLHKPFDPEMRRIDLSGKYGYSGGRLSLQIAGKGWVDVRAKHHAEEKPGRETLTIGEAAAIKGTVSGEWRDTRGTASAGGDDLPFK